MSPDLRDALRELAGAEPGPAPPADALWDVARRRTRRRRAAAGGAAAAAAGLVALAVWPAGGLDLSSPPVSPTWAVPDAHPARIAMAVPRARIVDRPPLGTWAILYGADSRRWAVTSSGAVTRMRDAPRDTPSNLSISPDGRWMVAGDTVVDLANGAATSIAVGQVAGRGLWAADSARVFVDVVAEPASPDAEPAIVGAVVAVDGGPSVTVPAVEGRRLMVAGWRDDRTLLALEETGDGRGTRLAGYAWKLGAPAWQATGWTIDWPMPMPTVAATMSPSGARILLRWQVEERGTAEGASTAAMLFDATTGKHAGMPLSSGQIAPEHWAVGSGAAWPGWGCRPAWNGEYPVNTDGVIAPTYPQEQRIAVSGRFHLTCASLAGDRFGARAVPNQLRAVQEWAWFRGLPALAGLGLLAGSWAGWRAARRRAA